MDINDKTPAKPGEVIYLVEKDGSFKVADAPLNQQQPNHVSLVSDDIEDAIIAKPPSKLLLAAQLLWDVSKYLLKWLVGGVLNMLLDLMAGMRSSSTQRYHARFISERINHKADKIREKRNENIL